MAIVTVSGIFAAYAVYTIESSSLLVCPGCNLPETVRFDHYTIQNNTIGQPSLLTIWFSSTGPAGKTLKVEALTLKNSLSTHDFTVQGVMIPALSTIPVTVDTSSQFTFAANQTYTVGLITDQYIFGVGGTISYPPENLIRQSYTIGYDQGQTNATVLTLTLVNVGNTPITLSSLSLKDQLSNFSPVTFPMSGPMISQPGATAQVTLDTLSSGFYFQHGHAYYLTITPTSGPSSTSTVIFQ